MGIVIGILIAMTVQNYQQRRHMLRTRYGEWRKLNLILQEVGKNYVDTVDVKGMTDAAVSAALAELDPHSIYMPPVQLEAAETELAGNFDGIGIQFNVPNDTAVVIQVITADPSD